MRHPDRAGAFLRPLHGLGLSFALAALVAACSGSVTGPGDDTSGTGGDTPGDPGSGGDNGGGGGGGQNTGDPNWADGTDFIPNPPTQGTVSVTLVPGPSVHAGTQMTVSFGAPFPPGALADASLLSARDQSGAELPISSSELLPWRAWPGQSDTAESVRAALVTVQVTFPTLEPLTIDLAYGTAPSASAALAAPADPRVSWVKVTDGEFPSGMISEPPVYATFPPSWLSGCLFRSRSDTIDQDSDYAWMDDSLMGFAHTAVNDVPAQVTELINYTSDYEPWLFDRSMTLFDTYFRTGEVSWLRHAHRSAQFYMSHIDQAGFFDLKGGTDLKYSYGRSLLTDFIFTGDPALIDTIKRIGAAGETWNPVYTISSNFWTERHQTYALMAALAAWEATGDKRHADRAKTIAQASFDMALHPTQGWHADGCMLHGMTAHEGAGGDVPICSPWMSALFSDTMIEYYVQSRDPAALTFLSNLGKFVVNYALYPGGEGLDYTMPWYLVSSVKQFSDDGPWGDIEHTCDVAGLVARAAWATTQLGDDPAPLKAALGNLMTSCQYNLNAWHRPGGPAAGKAEWRLTPARKFNWWFGTTNDLTWMVRATQ